MRLEFPERWGKNRAATVKERHGTRWIDEVEMRKRPGFHDEPLKGKRQGQRSIRLNKAYRAIYEIDTNGKIHFVEIIELNKHEY